MLLFTLAGFEIQHIASRENVLTITARALTPTSACPSCHQVSAHIHSYYTRSPQDLPISGQQVQLMLRVRRFRCPNLPCPRQTFAEWLRKDPGVKIISRDRSKEYRRGATDGAPQARTA